MSDDFSKIRREARVIYDLFMYGGEESEEEGAEDSVVRQGEPIQHRGIYMFADTPMVAHALALEDGSGDKGLLKEALYEQLTTEEIESLIEYLEEELKDRSHDDREACRKCGESVDFYLGGNPTFVTAMPCGCETVPKS